MSIVLIFMEANRPFQNIFRKLIIDEPTVKCTTLNLFPLCKIGFSPCSFTSISVLVKSLHCKFQMVKYYLLNKTIVILYNYIY